MDPGHIFWPKARAMMEKARNRLQVLLARELNPIVFGYLCAGIGIGKHGWHEIFRRDRPRSPPHRGSPCGPGGGWPPGHPHFSYALPLGPLAVQCLGAALGNPPKYHPRCPRERNGGSPISALHGHRIPRFSVTSNSLPGARVGGPNNSPPRTGRTPPYPGCLSGSADVLPRYPAGGCPGLRDPARVNLQHPTTTLPLWQPWPHTWATRG